MLGIVRELFRNVDTDTSQSRLADRNQQPGDGLAAGPKILKAGVDQIGPG